jgi:PAS domain S-box-containing protein
LNCNKTTIKAGIAWRIGDLLCRPYNHNLESSGGEHQKLVAPTSSHNGDIADSLYRAVVDTAVDAIVVIDRTGAIRSANQATERLFGYSADELLGKNVKILMPEPYAGEHDGYLANYLGTGTKKIIGIGREVSGRRKDGSAFPMELSVGEAQDRGEPIFVGIIRDITERKESELRLRSIV